MSDEMKTPSHMVRLTPEEVIMVWERRAPRASAVLKDAVGKLKKILHDLQDLRMNYKARFPPEVFAALRQPWSNLGVELDWFEENPGLLVEHEESQDPQGYKAT